MIATAENKATKSRSHEATKAAATARPTPARQSAVVTRRSTPHREAMLEEARFFFAASRAPKVRSIRQFAEEEIIIPSGDFEGYRYKCDRQPFTRLWFDEIDRGHWWEHWATGPSQSSKTLSCCLVVLCYILFELRETVIFSVPDMNLAGDKWRRDLLPVIGHTRYRDLVPTIGSGSRGGFPDLVGFKNGAYLKFMGAGGGDKQRAAFTSRFVVFTELEEFGRRGAESDESNKLEQVMARVKGYDRSRTRVFGECTVTVEDGVTWSRYSVGSAASIALKCPHCPEWVIPKGTDEDRKLLVGWHEAKDELEAFEKAAFACWHCGQPWSETERLTANREALLVHRGQRIEGDLVVGELPRTVGLGFRWTAIHNCMVPPGNTAIEEFRLVQETNESAKEEKERALHQFVWCIPHQPAAIDLTALKISEVTERVGGTPRGVMPADATLLTLFIDTGKWKCHWLALASRPDATATIIDYDLFQPETGRLGTARALAAALREFFDLAQQGWSCGQGLRAPDCVFIDSGYEEHTDAVYRFCMDAATNPRAPWRWYPCKGYGAGQERDILFHGATKTGAAVQYVGEEMQVRLLPEPGTYLVEINADHWKTRVHQALKVERGQPGSLSLYEAMPGAHVGIANHFTAERQIEEFVPGVGRNKGMIRRWERVRRNNHWFDCAAGAMAAASFCGAKLVPAAKPRTDQATKGTTEDRGVELPDGRRFHVLTR